VITLKTLKWNNCFSYAENNELKLDANTITQLVGVNGAGKSSIPLILEEVTYNKNSKNVKKADIPNRRIGEPYSIFLAFDVDDDEYTLDLVRKTALKLKLTKNGTDISSHTATNTFKTVEEILGIDFKTFTQLVYQNTNNSLQFLTATDTNRKKFLISLLNLEVYVQYFEEFKQLAKEYSSKVTALESQVSTIEKWLEENNLEGMKVLTPEKIDINLEDDEKLLGSLQLEFENISEINKKISKNENYRRRLDAIELKDPGVSKESTDDTISAISELRAKIKQLNTELSHIKGLEDVCPTCTQEVPTDFKASYIMERASELEVAKEFLLTFESKLERIKKNNALADSYEKAQREFETLYRTIDDSLPKELLNAEDLQDRINKLKANLAEKRQELQALIKRNAEVERNNTRIEVIKEQTLEFQGKLEAAETILTEVKSTYTNLEILKKAFSTNGLLAYKIEFLVKELEIIVNEYLTELSDGRFTLEFAINNDKLNVVLTDEGYEIDIISLSSGELARVTTATLLAIRKLMSSISKSRINVLFLDEVIAVLDEQGREKLVDILSKETELNTFIVSHEWSHPLLVKLDIVKENNVSKIEDG
jgi:DNA repair exonuclease SbcCD ATPase subunit